MLDKSSENGSFRDKAKPSIVSRVGEIIKGDQKTVAEMSIYELIRLRNRLYNQKRKIDNPRLDLQLHAVQGELKDRGYRTKKSMQEGSFMPFEKLTKKRLDEMEPGVFAQGTVSDNPVGVNMTGSGELLRWVAVRGDGPDWAVYVHWATSAWEYIASNGDKVYNKENVKKLIDADKEALDLYRD